MLTLKLILVFREKTPVFVPVFIFDSSDIADDVREVVSAKSKLP